MTRTVAAIVVFVFACALTSKSQPLELRYFEPTIAPMARPPDDPCARVRLGHVVASAGLRFAIERRISDVELQPYETLRWTETPDAYVRRAVVHALFGDELEQAVTGAALVLDIEVSAFEEVAHGAGRSGHVVLRYELRDDRRIVTRGEVSADRPAADATIEAAVRSIGSALVATTDELATRVVDASCRR